MRIFIAIISISFLFVAGCGVSGQIKNTAATPSPQPAVPKIVADSFAYPLSNKKKLTQAKDAKDDWYNALDFGENNHLGEDWNKNSGGNTDCGEPVYAAANGEITYAADAGPGWGNVLIVTHSLPDGKQVQTLYGHLQEIVRKDGDVKKRELVGRVGNANGKYLCHLHFELREENSPMWSQVGGGYSNDRKGWFDPSDFIDARFGQ